MQVRPALRLVSALCAVGVWVVPPVWLMALGLLLSAHTWPGRLAALCFLTAPPGLLLMGLRLRLRSLSRVPRGLGPGLLALGLLCYGAAWALSPDGEAPPEARLRSVWLDDARFRRGALANVVPEIDQFTLGSHLVPYADPYIDGPQAARIRGAFEAVYLELREAPDFLAAGSQMPRAYLDQLGGHLYVYDPGGEAPRPVILFLHGSAGPFKGYQWVWRSLAEAQGWAVVSPSFGFGHWARPEGVDLVQQTLDWIAAQPELDGERVVLAGLSNGGLGVSRAAAALPGAFEALIYLSPVIEPGQMPAVAAAHDGPVIVITGDADRRIPLWWVQEAVDALAAAGTEVSLEVAPGEDHFLFFTQREWCIAQLHGPLGDLREPPAERAGP